MTTRRTFARIRISRQQARRKLKDHGWQPAMHRPLPADVQIPTRFERFTRKDW